jgi:hypothetical protein
METTTIIDAESQTEREQIVGWRSEELERSGYPIASARRLASHTEIDLHKAIELLERGCPAATALRILL